MRTIVQRVINASVDVGGSTIASIGSGLVVLLGVSVAKGAFQEHMHVSLVNDGPVTFVVETP